MASPEQILERIRVLGRGRRGAHTGILHLPDSTLYEVFQQMQRGLSNRAIARHLLKCGAGGTENSLQQTVSLLRKRIAPLLTKDSTTLPLPAAKLEIPAKVSPTAPDDTLNTLDDMIKFYGQAIRQATQSAAQKGTPLSEDLIKHIKAYDMLVARKARIEQNAIKDRAVEPDREDPDDLRLLDLLANKVQEWLFDNGDGEKMVRASKRFLARIAQKCIYLKKDPVTGEWYEVKGFPGLNRTYDRNGFPIEDSEAQAESQTESQETIAIINP
ncbi:MAG: hypothetical protein ACLQPD_25435 [Desulfomonilaceae bacterium]